MKIITTLLISGFVVSSYAAAPSVRPAIVTPRVWLIMLINPASQADEGLLYCEASSSIHKVSFIWEATESRAA